MRDAKRCSSTPRPIVSMSFQLAIPWRVALPQSPPLLHQPGASMNERAAAGQQKPANGQLCLNYLSHPRGQVQAVPPGRSRTPVALGLPPPAPGLPPPAPGLKRAQLFPNLLKSAHRNNRGADGSPRSDRLPPVQPRIAGTQGPVALSGSSDRHQPGITVRTQDESRRPSPHKPRVAPCLQLHPFQFAVKGLSLDVQNLGGASLVPAGRNEDFSDLILFSVRQ